MLTFYNEFHGQHRGRFEIFRGEMVPCFEKPERADTVLAELGRRGLGKIVTPHGVPLMSLERIHTPRYLQFLRGAWSEWLALDPANAAKDAFPAVWPVRTLRDDIEPENFCAKLGLYSMDSGTPLTAGTWTAAKTGADCAVNAAHALLEQNNAPTRANILEAIYLMATLRSFRGVGGAQMVRHGAKGYFVGGKVVGRDAREIKMYWSLKERNLTLEGQPVKKLADYLGVLRTVVFCTEDLQLVKGASRIRRRFLDLLLAQTHPVYLPLLQRSLKIPSTKSSPRIFSRYRGRISSPCRRHWGRVRSPACRC